MAERANDAAQPDPPHSACPMRPQDLGDNVIVFDAARARRKQFHAV